MRYHGAIYILLFISINNSCHAQDTVCTSAEIYTIINLDSCQPLEWNENDVFRTGEYEVYKKNTTLEYDKKSGEARITITGKGVASILYYEFHNGKSSLRYTGQINKVSMNNNVRYFLRGFYFTGVNLEDAKYQCDAILLPNDSVVRGGFLIETFPLSLIKRSARINKIDLDIRKVGGTLQVEARNVSDLDVLISSAASNQGRYASYITMLPHMYLREINKQN